MAAAAVVALGIQVRGNGDPMPVLGRLMAIPGWTVADPRGRPPSLELWDSFAGWRDDTVRRIGDGE